MTRRQDIIQILEEKETTLRELILHFRIDSKEILQDLEAIRNSIAPKKLRIIPSQCRKCDFVFKERTKLKRPSKCPKCKMERISEPKFFIS